MKSRILLFFLIMLYLIAPKISAASVRLENGLYIVENCIGAADYNGKNKNAARTKAKTAASRNAMEKIFA